MKKNNIIVEVDRIREMMNLTILNEGIPAGFGGKVMKIIDDFVLNNAGTLSKGFDNEFKKLQKAFADGNLIQFKKSIGRLIDLDDDLYDIIKPNILSENKPLIDQIENHIKTKMGQYPPPDREILKKEINDYWRTKVEPNFPSRRFRDEMINKFDKQIDEFKRVLPAKVSTDTFEGKAKAWVSGLFGADIQSLRRIFFRWSKSYKELQDEFFKYAEEAEALMKRKPPQKASYQLKKMADILASMKKSSETAGEIMWNGLSEKGQQGFKNIIGADVAGALESGGKKWSDVFQAAIKGDKEIESSWKLLFETVRLRKFGPKRLINYVTYGDYRSIEEIREFMAQRGVLEYLGRRALSYFIVWPILKTVVMSSVYAFGKSIENLGGEDALGNITGYSEVEEFDDTFYRMLKEDLREQLSLEGLLQFVVPTYVDEMVEWFVYTFLAGKTFADSEESVEQELEQERVKIWNGFGKETQEVMKDAAEATGNPDLIAVTEGGGGSSPETETQSETNRAKIESITEPIARELYETFPCIADGNFQVNKISDKQAEFVNIANKKTRMAYKVKGSWYWEDATPLSC
jgi:hypothetical protein